MLKGYSQKTLMRFTVHGLQQLPEVRTGRHNNNHAPIFFFDIHLDKGDDGKQLCCTHVPDGFNVIGTHVKGGVITVLCKTPLHIDSESALLAQQGCVLFEFR